MVMSLAAWAPAHAAQLLSQGPVLAVGFSDESEGDLVHSGLGWRWELEAGRRANGVAERIGTELNWVLEPQAAILSNDRDGVEFQFLPMFQLTPRRWRDSRVVPSLEASIGLIYIDVTGFRLGSNVLFSDNIGLRLDFGNRQDEGRWAIAYRFRHISHAGIWADTNSGMNTHWISLSYQFGAVEDDGERDSDD
jgi:hypothetical protein